MCRKGGFDFCGCSVVVDDGVGGDFVGVGE